MPAFADILVATDFSELSRLALRRAAQLAQEHGAGLELLHVVEELPPEEEFPLVAALDAARTGLTEESRAEVPAGVPCRCLVEAGKDFVAIIRRARELPADLVVIGAHGRHSLVDYLVGTTAEKLARKAGLPLLVVKQPPQAPYRRLLVATDFSAASRHALEVAMALAPQAEIELLHVFGLWGEGRLSMAGANAEAREHYRRQARASSETLLKEWLAGVDLGGRHVESHLRQGPPATVIAQLAVERRSDLLVMATSGRSGLPYILLGSVAEQTLRASPCDTLVVRPPGFRFELL
jgi:nucleotide-binding universal stress UspA family protein